MPCHFNLGAPELAEDPRFTRNPDRVLNREACQEALALRMKTWARAELMQELAARAVPAG